MEFRRSARLRLGPWAASDHHGPSQTTAPASHGLGKFIEIVAERIDVVARLPLRVLTAELIRDRLEDGTKRPHVLLGADDLPCCGSRHPALQTW